MKLNGSNGSVVNVPSTLLSSNKQNSESKPQKKKQSSFNRSGFL
jgi:hypothetical protein